MGIAKSLRMEEEDRGYGRMSGFVGPECVDEPFIQRFIDESREETRCDFCGTESSGAFAAPADAVLAFVMEGVLLEYSSVDDAGVPYDSETGQYIVETLNGSDLLYEFPVDFGPAFRDAIAEAVDDTVWCQRSPMVGSWDEQQLASWEWFVELVTHRVRYVVYEYGPNPEKLSHMGIPIPPSEILTHIGASAERINGVLQELPGGTSFFRCHWSRDGRRYKSALDLGTPPPEKAEANRMSADGIAMFCGAFERETAMLETRRGEVVTASVGEFTAERPMWLLDLTSIPEVPSLWDVNNRLERSGLRFLHSFSASVSRPIDRNARPFEYAPTQFLTEFFRWVYRMANGTRLDGIVYWSAAQKGGRNVILFVDRNQLCDSAGPARPPDDELWLPATCLLKLKEVTYTDVTEL